MNLLGNNNIYEVIFTMLPVFLYAWLAIKFSGVGRLDPKKCFMHLMLGVLSFAWVDFFHFVFPQWHLPMDLAWALFFLTTVQTGLLEESMKFGCYIVGADLRGKSSPMDSMLYMMLVGCGFAIVENILYIKVYGDSVILPRALSVMVHMTCALVIGYFYNLRNVLPNLSVTHKKMFPFIGLSIAALYHGIFNANLLSQDFLTLFRLILIVIVGIFISMYTIEDLKRRTKLL